MAIAQEDAYITMEFFRFEEDFVEDNMRCIPMIVRFKMDIVGIKLPLSAWARFTEHEKEALAFMPVSTCTDKTNYDNYLCGLILGRTGKEPSRILTSNFNWEQVDEVPQELEEKTAEFGWNISLCQWRNLSKLKRFALLKLCRPGHENRNFPIAMNEFHLI